MWGVVAGGREGGGVFQRISNELRCQLDSKSVLRLTPTGLTFTFQQAQLFVFVLCVVFLCALFVFAVIHLICKFLPFAADVTTNQRPQHDVAQAVPEAAPAPGEVSILHG